MVHNKVSTLAAVILIALFTVVALPSQAQAQDFEMKPAFKFVDDQAEVKIIGGVKADPAEWPATFIFARAQKGSCTSTAIGPHSILTAAHCVNDQATGFIELPNRTRIAARCHHHSGYHQKVADDDPQWEPKVSPDFALCFTKDAMTGTEFERINADLMVLEKARSVHLLGFGCNAVGGVDRGFGILYEGDAGITSLPSGRSYYTRTFGGAAVCYGDSGGSAYLYLNQGSRFARVLIGVNSRGDIRTESLLSTTSVSGFVEWATRISKAEGRMICGLHPEAPGCRPI